MKIKALKYSAIVATAVLVTGCGGSGTKVDLDVSGYDPAEGGGKKAVR